MALPPPAVGQAATAAVICGMLWRCYLRGRCSRKTHVYLDFDLTCMPFSFPKERTVTPRELEKVIRASYGDGSHFDGVNLYAKRLAKFFKACKSNGYTVTILTVNRADNVKVILDTYNIPHPNIVSVTDLGLKKAEWARAQGRPFFFVDDSHTECSEMQHVAEQCDGAVYFLPRPKRKGAFKTFGMLQHKSGSEWLHTFSAWRTQ